jgi:hypothetical protein
VAIKLGIKTPQTLLKWALFVNEGALVVGHRRGGVVSVSSGGSSGVRIAVPAPANHRIEVARCLSVVPGPAVVVADAIVGRARVATMVPVINAFKVPSFVMSPSSPTPG